MSIITNSSTKPYPTGEPHARPAALGLLWEVKKADKVVGYFLGSTPVTPEPLLNRLHPQVLKAFKSCNTLGLELEFSNPYQQNVMAPTLLNHLSDKGKQRFRDVVAEGLKDCKETVEEKDLDSFVIKGMEKLRRSSLKTPTMQNFFLDQVEKGETCETWISMKSTQTVMIGPLVQLFESDITPEQIYSLLKNDTEMLRQGKGLPAPLPLYIEAFEKGDIRPFELSHRLAVASSPHVEQGIISENLEIVANMGKSIEGGNRLFAVIAAEHFVGPSGIDALMRKEGYTVTQQPASLVGRATPVKNLHEKEGKARGFLWEIQKADRVVGYFLGSVHQASDPLLSRLHPKIFEAFESCDTLACEADLGRNIATEMSLLISLLSPRGKERLRGVVAEGLKDCGESIRESDLAAFIIKGMEKLSQGPLKTASMELFFIDRAAKKKIPVAELETSTNRAEAVTKVLEPMVLLYERDDLSPKGVYEFLKSSVEKKRSGEMLDPIALLFEEAFVKGDLEMPQMVLNLQMSRDEFQKHIASRNPKMVAETHQLIERGKKPFTAVGVGHFIGPSSMVELMRQKGYTVTRLLAPPQSRL